MQNDEFSTTMTKAKKKLSKAEVDKKALRILGEARREPRFQAQRERDALYDAIRYGHSEIALSLLAHGVNVNSIGPKGRSILWYAAHSGRSILVRDLVIRGAPQSQASKYSELLR